jgi:L-cysteine desulfidase
MNITITISERALYGLEEAARVENATVEALASEVAQKQGIHYSILYGIGVLTSAAFVSRFTGAEYTAILLAAKQNQDVAALVQALVREPYVALDDDRLAPGLQLLVGAGLLTAARVAEILDYGLTA